MEKLGERKGGAFSPTGSDPALPLWKCLAPGSLRGAGRNRRDSISSRPIAGTEGGTGTVFVLRTFQIYYYFFLFFFLSLQSSRGAHVREESFEAAESVSEDLTRHRFDYLFMGRKTS